MESRDKVLTVCDDIDHKLLASASKKEERVHELSEYVSLPAATCGKHRHSIFVKEYCLSIEGDVGILKLQM